MFTQISPTKKSGSIRKSSLSCLLIVALSIAFFSCGDDPIADGPVTGADSESLYAVFWRVNTPDGRIHYTSLVEDLESGVLDAGKALEKAGNARFFAPEAGKYFVIGDPGDYILTRYDIADDNQIVEGGRFSMANEGITDLQNRSIFLSETKAYYIDYTQGQIIVWNPEEMSITKAFDLPEQLKDGYQGYWVAMPIGRFQLVDNRLYIPAGWINWDDETYLDKTGLAIIDIENDALISYTEDDRCPMAVNPAILENGDAYYGVSYYLPFATTAREIEDCGCILKVEAGANGFDKAYDPNYMNQIDGYKVGLSLANSPKKDHGYVRVLDPSKLEWSPELDGKDYYGLNWFTYEINLPTNKIVGKTDLPYAASYVDSPYVLDGDDFSSIQKEDGTTVLIKYAPDGSYTEGLSIPGTLLGLYKVR